MTQEHPDSSLALAADLNRRRDGMEPHSDADATSSGEHGRLIPPSPHSPGEVQSQEEDSPLIEYLGKAIAGFYALIIAILYDFGESPSIWATFSTMLDIWTLLVMIYVIICCCRLSDTVWRMANLRDADVVFHGLSSSHDITEFKLERLKADASTRRVHLAKLDMYLERAVLALLVGCILWVIRVCGPLTIRYIRILSIELNDAMLEPWLAITRFLWPELEIKIHK